jgi:hypothetical protein
MATRESDSYTLQNSNSDLTAKNGCFGKLVAGRPDVCGVLGEMSHFVITGGGIATAASDVAPRAGKIVMITVGAVAVAIGVELTPDANGLAKTAVSTNIVHALALQAGNPGETIRALWVDVYAKP